MKLILLSGGSGKRLWPLSNDSRSKQFLKVLQRESGNWESMVQRVWRQIGEAGLQQSAVIATSKAQAEVLRNQLGSDIHLILEPERRDTFPAIALAAAYLHSVCRTELEETVVVLPVDPYVENSYFQRIKQLDDILRQSNADLALMGVEPTFPSEKYGYIVPRKEPDRERGYYFVSHFREKPDSVTARQLMQQQAFWNCGVFAFSLGYMGSILRSKGLFLDYELLLKKYHTLPKISFDYEVVEKTESIVVLPYQGEWKDLGTWNTLTEEMPVSVVGKGIISKDSVHSHIINELDIPVVLIGLSNVIVAASPDGILVSDKDASHRIKDIADFDQRPMYEERQWGWYKVLDYTQYGHGEEMLTKKVGIHQGKHLSYHSHGLRSETWTIVKGEGEFVLEGQFRIVRKNDILHIPAGAKHAIRAISELEFIEVQQGSELTENDIQCIYRTWDEICSAFDKVGHFGL